jgi:DNA-binding PadR family transcriptional regulator
MLHSKESRAILMHLYDHRTRPGYGQDLVAVVTGASVEYQTANRALRLLVREGLIEGHGGLYRIAEAGEAEVEYWRSAAGRFEDSSFGKRMGRANRVLRSIWDRTNYFWKVVAWIVTALGAGKLLG